MDALAQFRHPAWSTGLGTVIAYGLILAVFTVVLFLVPYLVFTAL